MNDPFGWNEEEDDKRKEEEEEEELDDIPPPNETPEQRTTRMEAKKARGELFSALKNERERTARLEQRLGELQQGVQGMADYQQRQNQPDPLAVQAFAIDKEMSRLQQEALGLTALYEKQGQPLPKDVRDDWERRWRYAEERKQEVVTRRTLRDAGIQPAHEVRSTLLMAEHQDVALHGQANAYAAGVYQTLIAEGHPPNNPETIRLAAEKSRERFGLHKRPTKNPTSADRGRLSSPRGSGSGGGDDRTPAMPPELKKLARDVYRDRRDLTDEQKERLWMKVHGKQFREFEAQRTGRR